MIENEKEYRKELAEFENLSVFLSNRFFMNVTSRQK